MKKRLFTAVIALFLILPVTAFAVSNPIVHLSFEGVESGVAVNERDSLRGFDAVNVSEVFGYVGSGVRIGEGGGIFAGNGEIGTMLSGAAGVTLSAYIKNDGADSGNLFTIYHSGENPGIKLVKEGSAITAYASSAAAEALLAASYDTGKSFERWTHIAVGIDFARKMTRFYVNGVHLSTVPMAFAEDVFTFTDASLPDKIGDTGIMMDEVRINPANIHCSEPMTVYKLDSGYDIDEAYNDVLKDSLISYFPFDEGEGNTVYSKDGFIKAVGNAHADLGWTEGVRGPAVVFHPDEKNWINIGNNVTKALNGAKGLTVSGWFYLNKLPGSNTVNRALSLNIIEAGALCHLVFRNSGQISVSMRSHNESSPVGLNFINTSSAQEVEKFAFEQWHHVTVTTDLEAKTMRLFLDGEEILPDNETSSNHVAYASDSFVIEGSVPAATIGGDHSGSTYSKTFNGAMDELRIYNRAVTANEARYIYHENISGSVMSRDEDNYALLNTLSPDMLVLAPGHNEVMADCRRQRIDWGNPGAVPVIEGSTLFVPSELIEKLTDCPVTADIATGTARIGEMTFTAGSNVYTVSGDEYILADAPYTEGNNIYVPFRAVAERLGMKVYYSSCGLAAAGTPGALEKLEQDEDYVLWLYDALTSLHYKQQSADHYGTRTEIALSENPEKIFLSSPAVVKLGDGTLVASHDTTGHGTTVYRSADNGKTWQKVRKPDADNDDDNIDDTIEELVYANLFTNTPSDTGKEALYLMGVRRGTGEPAAVAIYRSDDGGLTWSSPKDNKTGWLVENDGTSVVMPAHTAPVPVVKKDGRIYRAFDISGNSWQNFKVVVMSADENADLLNRDSWTVSNTVQLTDYISKLPPELNCADPGICEANAVIGPDGEVYVLSRFNSAPSVDWAAVLKLTDDETLVFDKVISFPGGMSKFTVRYDETTGKYIALSNPNTQRDYSLQRICLSLLVSDDMYSWETAETLLVPDWLGNWEKLTQENAFQYPDFIFDGEDIVYAVREANIGAADYHNANCITLYRLENYKQYVVK